MWSSSVGNTASTYYYYYFNFFIVLSVLGHYPRRTHLGPRLHWVFLLHESCITAPSTSFQDFPQPSLKSWSGLSRQKASHNGTDVESQVSEYLHCKCVYRTSFAYVVPTLFLFLSLAHILSVPVNCLKCCVCIVVHTLQGSSSDSNFMEINISFFLYSSNLLLHYLLNSVFKGFV